jgi:Protein of unknown function (DUF4232)
MRLLRRPSARLIGAAVTALAAVLIPAAALGAAPAASRTASGTTSTPNPTATDTTPAPSLTATGTTPTAGPDPASAGPDAAFGGAPALDLTTADTPKCATSGLVVWLDTQGNGTAGSIYYTLEFTNLSARACMLGGYPGVSAVSLAGHQLGSAASRDRTTTPRMVTLASGASATAVLRIVEAGDFPTSSCRQVTAAGLRVYPPNLSTSKVVPFPFSACSRTGPVYLSVRAVKLS